MGQFINQLSTICGINKNSIILVPGNHDIFRDSIPEIAKKNRDSIQDRDKVAEIIGNKVILEQYSAGLKNYRAFLLKNFEWSKGKDQAPLSYTVNTTVNDVSISIVALNTAWLSYGGLNEKGKIVMGERQVRKALSEIDNPQITIVLMHHPFEWLEQFDANDVQRMLERRADFILNGHEHKSDIIGKGSIFGKAFKISAGSTYEARNRLNSYNIACCNLEEKSITCYLRKFQDTNGGFWIEDNSIDNSISNGKIKIRLPERLSEIVVNDIQINTNRKDEYWVSPSDSDIQIALPPIPRELIRQIREGNCILFAGAGTSLDAGLPSWSELLRNMVEKVDDCGLLKASQKLEIKYLLDNQDFVSIAEFCKEKLGLHDFAEFIGTNLNTKNRYSKIHDLLSQIPFTAAITTNYDNFIEKTHQNYRVILPNEISELDNFDVS